MIDMMGGTRGGKEKKSRGISAARKFKEDGNEKGKRKVLRGTKGEKKGKGGYKGREEGEDIKQFYDHIFTGGGGEKGKKDRAQFVVLSLGKRGKKERRGQGRGKKGMETNA